MTKKHRRFNLSGGTGWGYRKEQCSRIALFFFNDKARNTADENILYFLLGVQTLSRLVELKAAKTHTVLYQINRTEYYCQVDLPLSDYPLYGKQLVASRG